MSWRHQKPVTLSAHSLVIVERKVYAGLAVPVRALAQEAEWAGPMKRGSDPPYPLIHFPEERLVLDKSAPLLVHPYEPSGCGGRKRDLAVPAQRFIRPDGVCVAGGDGVLWWGGPGPVAVTELG